MTEYRFTYENKASDFFELNRSRFIHSDSNKITMAVEVLCLILLFLTWDISLQLRVMFVTVLLVLPLATYGSIYHKARKVAKDLPVWEVEMTEELVRFRAEGKSTSFRWGKLAACYTVSNMLILCPDSDRAYVIPFRCMNGKENEITEYCLGQYNKKH